MSWGLIPWSETTHKKMTYGELREQLMCMDEKYLQQTVTHYDIANDRVVPMYQTDYADPTDPVIPDRFVITF